MKKFEGKVNDKTFNDEQEFYKAAIEAMKGKGYNISSSYTESPEPSKEDSPKTPKTQENTPKTQEDSSKLELDRIKIEPLNSEGLLANDFKDLDSYIRSAEDRFDDWLVAFEENYEDLDINDILNQERVQRLNLESFKKDYNEQLKKVNQWYETSDSNRMHRYDALNDAKKDVEKHEKELLEYVRASDGTPEMLVTMYNTLNDAKAEVAKLRNSLVDADDECKRLIVEKNYLAKIEGYIKIYDEYLKGIRDIIDLYTAGGDAEENIAGALKDAYKKMFGVDDNQGENFLKSVSEIDEDEFIQWLRNLKKSIESWKM